MVGKLASSFMEGGGCYSLKCLVNGTQPMRKIDPTGSDIEKKESK